MQANDFSHSVTPVNFVCQILILPVRFRCNKPPKAWDYLPGSACVTGFYYNLKIPDL